MSIRSKITRVFSYFKKVHRQRIGDHNSMDGFGFVMNVLSLDAASYELAPKSVLKHASDEEVELIKQRLEKANLFQGLEGFHGLPWEKKLFATPGLQPIELRPKEQWRYFVISFEGTNIELENVAVSSCLASIELEVAFTLLRMEPQLNHHPMVFHPDRLFQWLKVAMQDTSFRNVARADVEEIRSINSQLNLADARIRN